MSPGEVALRERFKEGPTADDNNVMQPQPDIQASWYPDPTDPGVMRYWDGENWTGQEMPSPSDMTSAGDPPVAGSVHAIGGTPVVATAHTAPVHRGPHYVLGFGDDHDGFSGPGLDLDGDTLVTGEVPPGYDRVRLECEGGAVVNATFLDPASVDDANLFIALVHHRVVRMVATKDGGRYGVFFDVALLEESEISASSD